VVPNYIGRYFSFISNPLQYIYLNYIKNTDNIELFNEYRIIEGNILYLNRFITYIEHKGFKEPDMKKLKKYYIIK